MKIAVSGKSTRLLVARLRMVLFAAAAGLLGYCALVLANTWILEKQAVRTFDRLHFQVPSLRIPAVEPLGGLVGRMEIPRLGVSVAIAEGADEATLRRAAGHIPGTALPGRSGNVGIAGHRDTLFRPLRNIQQDDVILLITMQGEYRYHVVSTKVVSPYDVAVLEPDGNEILTLVTCYPFYFVGPAPSRFIVRAERRA